MIDKAMVAKIDGHEITLRCGPQSACESCSTSMFCKVDAREFIAANTNHLELNVGDKVEFYIPTDKSIRTGFILLMMPLILFLLFYFVAESVMKIDHPMIKVLIGIAGLAAGFGINMMFKLWDKKPDLPEIVKIIE